MSGVHRRQLFILFRHHNPTTITPFRWFHTPPEVQSKVDNHLHKAIYLHKSRGQHILTNPRVLDSIVKSAGIRPTDTVLEIGPGTGNLTVKLLESARSVVAVEIDPRMVEILHQRVEKLGLLDRLTVIKQDILKTKLPDFDLCVSNIPYKISSPLISTLLYTPHHSFRSATLLLQKEFARRLLSNPGHPSFSRLSINVNLVSTVTLIQDVSKYDFVPVPKVDSSVVCICPRPKLPLVDLNEWHAFTLLCFGKKNKTLGAIFRQKKKVVNLMGNFCMSSAERGEPVLFKEKMIGILKVGGFEEKRASKLSHDELLELLLLFNNAGIYFKC